MGGGKLPNHYIGGVAVDPALRGAETSKRLYLAFNGYSRKWGAGPRVSTIPSAGKGPVFMSSNNGQTWTDVSTNLPDVPLNSITVLAVVAGFRPRRRLPGTGVDASRAPATAGSTAGSSNSRQPGRKNS